MSRCRPLSYKDKAIGSDCASKLYLKTKASFYKFNKGSFKTYFVLGLNCVIHLVIYQNYSEKEYQCSNGIVVSKKTYNQLTIK